MVVREVPDAHKCGLHHVRRRGRVNRIIARVRPARTPAVHRRALLIAQADPLLPADGIIGLDPAAYIPRCSTAPRTKRSPPTTRLLARALRPLALPAGAPWNSVRSGQLTYPPALDPRGLAGAAMVEPGSNLSARVVVCARSRRAGGCAARSRLHLARQRRPGDASSDAIVTPNGRQAFEPSQDAR